VAALRHDVMTAPMMITGAMNGEVFVAYVEQCLVPTLKRGDIVVMDNVRRFVSPRGRWAAVNARGHDRVPKIAVRRLVAGDDPAPTRVIRYR
jgi:transposase